MRKPLFSECGRGPFQTTLLRVIADKEHGSFPLRMRSEDHLVINGGVSAPSLFHVRDDDNHTLVATVEKESID